MPVLARFCGIVIRVLSHPTFGTHYHAFYGDCELVIGLNPVRVIEGEAPDWVRECALDWVTRHQSEFSLGRRIEASFQTPVSGQTAVRLSFAE